ncbi:hypothetical protein TRFO_27323 [Tritrichomonas foetus]|uniref:Uncharacterized protein n=1 Tax=Tritrichomonas foetus TaxID=1144522 RepID=A0A1J4K2J2_9EUKA|nr:hypothetical protein TRFO_27323 [Tritrichomonas foetus]|eukprot:OHT05016.1 hypothetical protein TRFO_27323 [Tritrichomonas foetus]
MNATGSGFTFCRSGTNNNEPAFGSNNREPFGFGGSNNGPNIRSNGNTFSATLKFDSCTHHSTTSNREIFKQIKETLPNLDSSKAKQFADTIAPCMGRPWTSFPYNFMPSSFQFPMVSMILPLIMPVIFMPVPFPFMQIMRYLKQQQQSTLQQQSTTKTFNSFGSFGFSEK